MIYIVYSIFSRIRVPQTPAKWWLTLLYCFKIPKDKWVTLALACHPSLLLDIIVVVLLISLFLCPPLPVLSFLFSFFSVSVVCQAFFSNWQLKAFDRSWHDIICSCFLVFVSHSVFSQSCSFHLFHLYGSSLCPSFGYLWQWKLYIWALYKLRVIYYLYHGFECTC